MRNGLLTPISTKNNITIDLKIFSCLCYFYTSYEIIESIKEMLNIELIMSNNKRKKCRFEHTMYRYKFDCANIKFKKRDNAILVIEIIELLRLLGLCFDDNRLLVFNISVHSQTRERDIITIDAFAED